MLAKRRILLVEDDLSIQLMTRLRLEHSGYEVISASDGQEALERLTGDGEIDLVLLDLKLPKVDGFEICQRLKSDSTAKRIPIVVFTSSSGKWKQLMNRCVDLGVTDSLKKPFRSQDLLQKVRRALKEKEPEPSDRRGFTLVELMIAILLLVGGVAASTFVMSRGIFATTDVENMSQAGALAQEKLEQIRGRPANEFSLIANELKDSVFGWTGFSREVVVTQPPGTNSDFKQVVVAVYWTTTGGELSTSRTSYVANIANN
mgnify:CR=1 FL=1